MTPKDQAKEMVNKYLQVYDGRVNIAKKCALIAIQYIINSNPNSNPFNTEIYSTMEYWLQVKKEIQNL